MCAFVYVCALAHACLLEHVCAIVTNITLKLKTYSRLYISFQTDGMTLSVLILTPYFHFKVTTDDHSLVIRLLCSALMSI